MNASSETDLGFQSPTKSRLAAAAGSKIPKLGGAKGKGRKGMTLGRLNMLARPKRH